MVLDTELRGSLGGGELLGTAAVGAVTFPTLLAVAQTAVFKPLRITVASRLSPLFGAASVSAAGFAASLATIKTCSLIQNTWESETKAGNGTSRMISFSTAELMVSTFSSVVVFRAVGGRFSSVLPSHLFHPGAFARERIPAIRGLKLANSSEKSLIRDYGRRYGCHTCGKKQVGGHGFVSDHQPPSHLLKNSKSSGTLAAETTAGNLKADVELSNDGASVRQFFYPQCYKCSSLQGGSLNNGSKSKAIVTHPLSLRLYHLFLPVPFVVAYLKSSLLEGESMSYVAKLTTPSSDTVKNITSKSDVTVRMVDKATQATNEGTEPAVMSLSGKNTLQTFIQDSDIPELVSNFPLLIVWKRAVEFLDSFKNPGDAFHIMLWAFVIVAAWGTI